MSLLLRHRAISRKTEVFSENDFVTEWDLPGGPFTFPAGNTGTYNAEINFDDGTGWKTVTAYNDANLTVTLPAGVRQIRVRGTFPWFYINNGTYKSYITSVIQWGNVVFSDFTSSFYGASNLTSIPSYLPDGYTVIGSSMYRGCSSLNYTPNFTGITTIGIQSFLGCKLNGNVTLPASITTVLTECFRSSNIQGSVTISATITSIVSRMFNSATITGTLTINSAITSVQLNAFLSAIGPVGDLILPDGLTDLGTRAFQGTEFNGQMVLPSSISSIGIEALNNIPGITVVYCYASTAPTLTNPIDFTLGGTARPLHVPVGATGYDVAPWTDTSIFSSIIFDL